MPKKQRPSIVDIEMTAWRIRQQMGFDKIKRPKPFDVLARAQKSGIIKSFSIVPDEQIAPVEAKYDPDSRSIEIGSSAAEKSARGSARMTFTIAHELGHAVLGHKMARNRRSSGRDFGRQVDLDEREANAFAASFLVPLPMVDLSKLTDLNYLTTEFGVSPSSAAFRSIRLRRDSKAITAAFSANKTVYVGEDYADYINAVLRQAKRYPERH